MSKPPLASVRVIELGHVMAGPVCGRMLADLGADVVKIEPPAGDPSRTFAPGVETVERMSGATPYAMLNRNKRGVVVDLKSPDGPGVVARMLGSADVLVENFRPGTLDRMGLGFERLRVDNPGLVYCSITGFGSVGPLSEAGGFDLIAQGITGLMSITGEAPGRPPTKCGPPLTDITAGVLGALGVASALHARKDSGLGRRVESSLYQAGAFQTLWHSAIAWSTGTAPGPLGTAHPLAAPYEAFPTKDGWITIGGSNQGTWLRLLDALDMPALAEDPRFRTNPDRVANVAELRPLLAERFRQESRDEWLERLSRAGVPAGPVAGVDEMLAHPQSAALGVVDRTTGGDPTLGSPIRFDPDARVPPTYAPELGADTRSVLAEYGFTSSEVDRLTRSGTIA